MWCCRTPGGRASKRSSAGASIRNIARSNAPGASNTSGTIESASPSQSVTTSRCMWASYCDAKPNERDGGELYRSVYREGKFLVVGDGAPIRQHRSTDTRTFEIIRDYTMHERAEAPQSYPPVARDVSV